MRIALGLQYNGAPFSGWQSQQHRNTVQDVLERALTSFATCPLKTVAAGRTDAGVHALGQVVHFDTEVQRPMFAWVRGVNAFLPDSIAVQWAKQVPAEFHARFSAHERTYYYMLYTHAIRSPLLAGRAGWVHQAELDLSAMRAAARILLGEHDFSAFRSSECQAKSPCKHLYALDIEARGHFIHFRFRANAFLHHMVRNIMGCLIEIGRSRQSVDWLKIVLAARERRHAAPTFMADGLYLAQIGYPLALSVPAPELASQSWGEVWSHSS
ncbi:tRNA pseudouridine synthase A [Mycoavidus cysteinexigens]|uniref:tRNA pseudouridine synthase A n=1 Tax=Mycoavidus cysteinexigens TaxID=1553431 RepID=A0A2Z6EX42_9BURK|nr:tRNA pseudouridine(38-40) synthase TruA [Mycoavidus cysteinexigens]BBE10023.1 tRNA pseudouridine synthase A [Mycoavidus cysteinexigens]GAM53637.1 tRNA pseudouridine synthase A [bacterium endosymbiont of Mortierella elongata FMR23-6]GLR01118.1 tRNA pseudouridine synthase A [Mycoavidus cysteinexigens]